MAESRTDRRTHGMHSRRGGTSPWRIGCRAKGLRFWPQTAWNASNWSDHEKQCRTPAGRPSWCRWQTGEIQARNHDLEPAGTFTVDRLVAEASVDDYDALLLPGGTVNPDKLRIDDTAVEFVRAFVDSGKPVATICHGPWTLVEAGVVGGRTLTSYPSVRTDLRNAGATVVDEKIVIDGNLISSRSPDDLPAFCHAIVDAFAQSPAGSIVP
jgi:protease I